MDTRCTIKSRAPHHILVRTLDRARRTTALPLALLAAMSVIVGACDARKGMADVRPARRSDPTSLRTLSGQEPPERIPAAWIQVASGRQAPEHEGRLLYHRWVIDGRTEQREPGNVVRWPEPVVVENTRSTVRFLLDTRIPPAHGSVGFFKGIDEHGVPEEEIRTAVCDVSASTTDQSCALVLDDDHGSRVQVRTHTPEYSSEIIIVVYAAWYVPFEMRSRTHTNLTEFAASWGFVVRRGSVR